VENAGRFNVCRWGRRTRQNNARWKFIASETAIDGFPVGWFSPSYKYLTEVMREVSGWLAPIIVKADMTEKRLSLRLAELLSSGRWENKEAGRSRKYKRVILDEVGIVPDLADDLATVDPPTLTDYMGDAWFLGTPRGRREFQPDVRVCGAGQEGMEVISDSNVV